MTFFSQLTFVAGGVGPYPIRDLPYLSTAHLSATVNGVPVSATFDDFKKTATLAVAPAAGATVRIVRVTPRDQDDRLVQFLALPNGRAGLTADLLDTDYRQNLYVLQEGRDAVAGLSPMTGMHLGDDGHWDAISKRIENAAVGSNPNDIVTIGQLTTADTTTRSLPAVTGADNDDGLFVTAGEFAKRTPAQSRVHLGLGTVAVLNAGTAANNVPQFSADSPPRYPTADGRNIDLTNHAITPLIAKRALTTIVKVSRLAVPVPNLFSATWNQSSSARVSFGTGTWTARVELDNGGLDINGNFSGTASRFDLTAGTYRIVWAWRLSTGAPGENCRFMLTNADDSASQIIHVDYGIFRLAFQKAATPQAFEYVRDQHIIASASNFSVCFRFGADSATAVLDHINVIIQKISSSSSFS